MARRPYTELATHYAELAERARVRALVKADPTLRACIAARDALADARFENPTEEQHATGALVSLQAFIEGRVKA